MNDRELLEMAAKAAFGGCVVGTGNIKVLVNDRWKYWNPLADDGDALRLAVKLQLTVCNEHISAGAAYCVASNYSIDSEAQGFPEVDSGGNESEIIPNDYVATRRAIVMAAAQIGRSMP